MHGRPEGSKGLKCSPWIWSFGRTFGQNTNIHLLPLKNVLPYDGVKWVHLGGCVTLCYDCFSEKPKFSNVELG